MLADHAIINVPLVFALLDHRYADLLQKKLDTHGTQCFLINTGWTGGGYGVGKRMSIKATRACVNSVLDGSINKTKFTADPVRRRRRRRPGAGDGRGVG